MMLFDMFDHTLDKIMAKLPLMFDQNPPHTRDQIVAKHIPMKNGLKPGP